MVSEKDKQKFREEMLSPVSKLDHARRQAALDQKKRIEAACARKVSERRQAASKRKAISSYIEPHLKKKLRDRTIPEAVESTSQNHAFSQFLANRSTTKKSSSKSYQINESMDSTAEACRVREKFIEGEEIKQAILKGSGSRSRRIERRPNESTHAYALRAASIRKQEREHEKQQLLQCARNEMKLKRELKEDRKTKSSREKEISYSTEPEEEYSESDKEDSDEYTSDQEQDDDEFDDNKTIDKDQYEDESAGPFSWLLFTSIVGVVFVSFFIAASSHVPKTPFCNNILNSSTDTSSDMDNRTIHSTICRPCPVRGHCGEGMLLFCDDPFVVDEDQCLESSVIERDAGKMAQELHQLFEEKIESTYCSLLDIPTSFQSIINKIWENNFPLNRSPFSYYRKCVTMTREDMEEYLRERRIWRSTSDILFNVTYGKALSILAESKGIRINFSNGIAEMNLHQGSWSCQLIQCVITNIPLFVSIFVMACVMWNGTRRRRERTRDEFLIRKMLDETYDKLVDQSKSSFKEMRGYPCDNLRDHVFDVMGFHGQLRRHASKKLWPIIEQAVLEDSRIRQRNVLQHGREVAQWEWISPDISKSGERKRTNNTPSCNRYGSSTIQKTLDFEEEDDKNMDATERSSLKLC